VVIAKVVVACVTSILSLLADHQKTKANFVLILATDAVKVLLMGVVARSATKRAVA
jgi:hypothetical protein